MSQLKSHNIYVAIRLMISKNRQNEKFTANFTLTPFYDGGVPTIAQTSYKDIVLRRNPKHDTKNLIAFDSEKIYLYHHKGGTIPQSIKQQEAGRTSKAYVTIHDHKGNMIAHLFPKWYYEHEQGITIYEYKTTAATNAQNPNHQVTVQLNTQTCPHTYDGAIKVAEYIVEEIKRNVKSKIGKTIRLNNEMAKITPTPSNIAFKETALAQWAFMVRTDGDWDHKWKIEADKNLNSCTQNQENNYVGYTIFRISDRGNEDKSHYHKYKNYDYYYDVWSNIHYGYVGLSVGFSEEILLTGSAVQQRMQDGDGNTRGGDTPDDITCMKIGFELFKQFGEDAGNLKAINILEALDKTPINSLKVSKKMHWCLNPKNPVMQIPHKTIRAPLCNS